jgi:hypothetical protein
MRFIIINDAVIAVHQVTHVVRGATEDYCRIYFVGGEFLSVRKSVGQMLKLLTD